MSPLNRVFAFITVQMNCLRLHRDPVLSVYKSHRTVRVPQPRRNHHSKTLEYTSQLLALFPPPPPLCCILLLHFSSAGLQQTNTVQSSCSNTAAGNHKRGSVLTTGHPRYRSNCNTAVALQFSSVLGLYAAAVTRLTVCPSGRGWRG